MGCVPSKRQEKHKNTLLNFAINPISLEKYSQTVEESVKDSKKLSFICRKFKIPEPEPKIFSIDLTKLYSFGMKGGELVGQRMNIIIKDYQNLTSNKSYFYSNVHHVCVPDFNIEICLTVFVVYLTVHNIKVEASQEYPYLNITNDRTEFEDLIRSWQDFIGTVYKLYEDYNKFKFYQEVSEKTEFLAKKYEGIEDKKAKKKAKYFKQLVQIFNDFIQEIKELMIKIKHFANVFARHYNLFEGIAKAMNGNEPKKCENLIHLMF